MAYGKKLKMHPVVTPLTRFSPEDHVYFFEGEVTASDRSANACSDEAPKNSNSCSMPADFQLQCVSINSRAQ